MYNLLSILTISIGNVSWLDISTFISTLIAIMAVIVYIYRFARSRVTKEDMDKALKKKADQITVDKDMMILLSKITEHEKNNNIRFDSIKDHLEEINTSVDNINENSATTSKRIDDILKMLTDMGKK